MEKMLGQGLDRWKRQLVVALHDGHKLLTCLNEGVLRRVGVPKRKAKEVMSGAERPESRDVYQSYIYIYIV